MAQVQNPDSAATDTVSKEVKVTDSLKTLRASSVSDQKAKVEFGMITPWLVKDFTNEQHITADSLLRWQLWPNWGDYQAYRRDVISYRQGSIGRIDAFHINGYGPYEQKLYMEGLSLNNPVTGLPNYNLVPHRKIGKATESMTGGYESDLQLRDYYILKPISYLNYDESSGAYRNLEFLVAQNFTERTNLELSYWDRRGGGYYPNSGVEGSQIVGRIYHHLNEKYLIRGMYLRNQLNSDESLGYRVDDPAAFSFDEFLSTPNSTSANSAFTRWDLVGGIYHRADTTASEDAGFETLISTNKSELFLQSDTVSWDVQTFGATLFKNIKWGITDLRTKLSYQQHEAAEAGSLTRNSWSDLQANLKMGIDLLPEVHLYTLGEFTSRNDGMNGYDLSVGLKGTLLASATYNLNYALYQRIPTMQAMYWNSGNYTGNENLQAESGSSLSSHLELPLGDYFSIGSSGRLKVGKGSTFLSADNSFINSQNFQQLAGMIYARFDNKLLEIESSATFQTYDYDDMDESIAALNVQDQAFWLRNSAFVKGYVFDRAAFLKIGIKTLLSPLYYQSRSFNTELGFWQGNSSYQELPPFFRLDGELSARVRRIMVVIRWENALDGIGQAGYFETAGFPMPPRRLMVGIRAQFRN